jgi:nitrite reductase (NO-forming)
MSQLLTRPPADPARPAHPAPPPVDTAAAHRYCWVRIGVGLIWGIDATLKWLPGFRHQYAAMIADAAQGQPRWLSGWFTFWNQAIAYAPATFAVVIALAETAICLSLILGLAQRLGFGFGIVFALLVWGVGEGFGGPYASGATDIGAAIMYAVTLAALWIAVPRAVRTAAPAADHRLARYPALRWATFHQ